LINKIQITQQYELKIKINWKKEESKHPDGGGA
jgi:hypothetical protein